MSKGEYAKASKFFEKSLRLFPLPGRSIVSLSSIIQPYIPYYNITARCNAGVKALKDKADKLAADPPSSSSSSSHNGHHHQNSSNSGRASASADTGNSAGNSNNSSSNDLGGRSFTPEQESGSKKILALSKRSHYDVSSCVL